MSSSGSRTRQLLVSAAAAVSLVTTWGIGSASAAKPGSVTFALHVNPPFLACVGGTGAKATATVTRGPLNDVLQLTLTGFKPNLAFDLFTVQRSNLRFDGTVDPNFKNFGLAWYQSDVHTDAEGQGKVFIRTILLDQIFGFDPDATLPPTNTFHLGFWFNNPNTAKPCGFDPTKPTPFNGEHKAGPVAFISVPKRATGLGPLCSDPNTSTVPATCNP